jgi:hypothetical protein
VPAFEPRSSTLVVPVALSLDDLQRVLERETPHQLWSIDKPGQKCVPGQRVKVFGKRLKVTPDIDCRIVGTVTRGAVSLTGSGERLTVVLPIRATISARDIGGVLKGETATASATVRADVRPGLDRNWNPSVKVSISYDWKQPPGIDFLGQRIGFADRADARLAGVVADLERKLQAAVARAQVRPAVARAWEAGFTNIRLSSRNPPAWMRVTPTGTGLSGYAAHGRTLTLTVAVRARTETFVGDEPPAPKPAPLPPQIPPAGDTGLSFFMPVMADYAQLEPVVLKALRKLAAKGIRLEGVGHVNAEFDQVTIYATTDNRLAVGIAARAEPVGQRTGASLGQSRGTVWLTGVPVSEANSQVVRVHDLEIFGRTDAMSTNLLLRLAANQGIRVQIAEALTQDFTKDYDKVLDKAARAIADRQQGAVRFSARMDKVEHGPVQVTGAGLFMPMVVSGTGEIAIAAPMPEG